ncbi:MAG: hypothetical protein Ct9H300mP27_10250 [Chloroflexota bacterium]|nr:MAG: hypothetical protein Ct9H300mP27_10250 [Chloroflexota bacterium]
MNKPAGMVLTADGNVLIVIVEITGSRNFTLEANISANLVFLEMGGTVQSPMGDWSDKEGMI